MNPSEYDNCITELDDLCKDIIADKRLEYSQRNSDVLHNFKRAAAALNISPLQVAYIFLDKHMATISQICRGVYISTEPVAGRVADARNYLDIIYALIIELRLFHKSGKDD